MSGTIKAAALLAAIALAVGGGYWLGRSGAPAASDMKATAAVGAGAKTERKLLFYRNPMGLPDTSPVPKKDPMGMDYVPVYEGGDEGEPAAANQLKISTEKVQKLGVRTEKAQRRALDRLVRASGRVAPDERRLYAIAPKFEGYVERLHVNVTGQPVGKGQPLFEVYSPELVSAQREYAIAAAGVESLQGAAMPAQSSMKELAEASLLRLRNWDISEEQLKALAKSGDAKRTMTFRSPVTGIVTEKKALQGMRFMPGDALYQVADLSTVWVLADVSEQDIGFIKTGAKADIRVAAYPGKTFEGRVTYVYPNVNAETRTVPVRLELANPGLQLKPAMFAQVDVSVPAKAPTVTVPLSAVIDSGTRQIVLVEKGEGRFEPREVKLGERSENYVDVVDGVKEGESVVVAANFLIDAESNLKAAVGGFGHAGHGGSMPKGDAPAAPAAAAGHRAEGTVESADPKTGMISLNHGAVASLKWPAMTMEFKVANESLLKDLKPGARVAVEFVERKPGEWVITSVQPATEGVAGPAPAAANPHAGH